ncbi:MAG: DNA-binding protein [Calditrichaeota bacterium]|nr:MAG: DNA-binding protein [Calditrichota bacterium]MBL1207974.1 DNA-binding protein [Calditrichota bacterium]NOG47810.1 hypothetical protein [Calditrichota bacterium]
MLFEQDQTDILEKIFLSLQNIERVVFKKEKPFLNMEETDDYLCLSKQTLYAYTSRNVIPYYNLQGRRVNFKIEDLNNFVLKKNNRVMRQEEIESKSATWTSKNR